MLKLSGIEPTGQGIGVSTTVRKKYREADSGSKFISNKELNTVIAGDFIGAKFISRFLLKSGEVAEIRKSSKFYYVAVIRSTGKYDILTIQSDIKPKR